VALDLTQLYKLALRASTVADVAQWFCVSERTVYRRLLEEPYASIWARGQAEAKVSVRAALFGMKDTNATAAIFLAKNLCGMTDKVAHEHAGPGGGPIAMVTTYADLAREAEALIRKGVRIEGYDYIDGELVPNDEGEDTRGSEDHQPPDQQATPGMVGRDAPIGEALAEAGRDPALDQEESTHGGALVPWRGQDALGSESGPAVRVLSPVQHRDHDSADGAPGAEAAVAGAAEGALDSASAVGW